ncbi:MltA domain-containing protein [Spirulina sp. CCNP1310]|uniref:murein transglycosylase A n=1 Tax=Spirulina sp. CCNP1310 TaxID=3110249 RepID=UPI002B1FEA58|nr:MltA domain-containing protein [Spirulina sp. CCNP1310]MEA5419053.1 MltA domain-containing protein [Spirulina sp. CCNP1310]
MKKLIAGFALGLSLAIAAPHAVAQAQAPLTWVNPQRQATDLGFDEQLWRSYYGGAGDKAALIQSIDHSLRYLNTPSAAEAYRNYPIRWITRDRTRRSLLRFRELLQTARSPQELQAAVKREFTFYRSVGLDNQGTVYFTGYYEPIYQASRVRTAEYRYPLYRRPADLEQWAMPHPTRIALEGVDGMGTDSRLAGNELVWLRDRLEAYLVHIQGSAQLKFPDGSIMTVGYHGSTDFPYVSIGQLMIRDGLHPRDGFTLPKMINIFNQQPDLLTRYLPQNDRFIFFRDTQGAPATGSLGVPVTADRSIATDRDLMPAGALALIRTQIPFPDGNGGIAAPTVSRFVLDQDRGSAIRTPGRVDVYMGTGEVAGLRAGVMGYRGQLYYLMLKE